MSGPNTGKYGPEITPYLDTFHTMQVFQLKVQYPRDQNNLDLKKTMINIASKRE